jgi:hypothetical protein
MTTRHKLNSAKDKAVRIDVRHALCLAYFTNEADADAFAVEVRANGDTFRGGYFDGKPCGREPGFDYVDQQDRYLYAVSYS